MIAVVRASFSAGRPGPWSVSKLQFLQGLTSGKVPLEKTMSKHVLPQAVEGRKAESWVSK